MSTVSLPLVLQRKRTQNLFLLSGSPKSLPACQRRGAIITLGMFALAKRSVVSEKVDVLLRVGLGPLGKVRRLTVT